MRERGYNVYVGGAIKKLRYNPELAWEVVDKIECKGKSVDFLINSIKEYGDGARVQINVIWKDTIGDDGHSFLAKNINGEIQFIDIQKNKLYSDNIFDIIKFEDTTFWRIDNAEISQLGTTACITEEQVNEIRKRI